MSGLYSPILEQAGFVKGALESAFTPLDLFSNGEQGVWYDPSDLSTLFQDAAGTTPVTSDGDPVGLMLDKSGNANHATQSVSASRPTYRTDGTLHWLEGDGVDDVLQSLNVPYNGTAFFTSYGVINLKINYGGWCFDDGSDVHYLEEYTGRFEQVGRKAVVQRKPDVVAFYDVEGVTPDIGNPYVSYNNQGVTFETGVIPTLPKINLGAKVATSSTANLRLFNGYASYLGNMKIFGFVWLSRTATDEELDAANTYLAKKSGVQL